MIDYTKQGWLMSEGILTPTDAPDWMHNRETLWNVVETTEKQPFRTLAWDFVLTLPAQMNEDQMRETVTGFLETQFVVHGHVCDYAIHAPRPGDRPFYHAHALVTGLVADENGFSFKGDALFYEPGKHGKLEAAWGAELDRIFTRDNLSVRKGSVSFGAVRSSDNRSIEAAAGIDLGPATSNPKGVEIEAPAEYAPARNAEHLQASEAFGTMPILRRAADRHQESNRHSTKDEVASKHNDRAELPTTRKPKSRGWDFER